MNPDCAQGKHKACAGDAWDFDTDQPTRCDCDCHRPRVLRAITIRQPWAWAVIHGGKDVENRTRNIAGDYRDLVAIHAGLAKFEQHTMASRALRASHGTEVDSRVLYGCVIGVVDLTDVHRCRESHCSIQNHRPYPVCFDDKTPMGRMCSEWAMYEPAGIYHLILANPRPLATPVPATGRLGLWTLPDDIAAKVTAQIGGAL